ncbi:uncharacterized protein LOC143229960 isoform X2 [Tachypleus tridentatus]|uniref:uncharacterized protein LOC143229960 isoform X2 n=1 Tax=Tachypleus tridentatus TaxID=6853 RepID=UPI003FD50CE2
MTPGPQVHPGRHTSNNSISAMFPTTEKGTGSSGGHTPSQEWQGVNTIDRQSVSSRPGSAGSHTPSQEWKGVNTIDRQSVSSRPGSAGSQTTSGSWSTAGTGYGRTYKSGALKRVSFGSSRGSMVETLVFDNTEDMDFSPLENHEGLSPSRVRVSLFESQKPVLVLTPESTKFPFDFIIPSNMTSTPSTEAPSYGPKKSSENGIDNPFRPDGDLSKEAESIVCLIKEGKPITPTKGEREDSGLEDLVQEPTVDEVDKAKEVNIVPSVANSVTSAKADVNGDAPKTASPSEPAIVEVQHGIVVPPADSSQVESVVIKKKPKCRCCVIQ